MKCFYGNDWNDHLFNGNDFPHGGFKRNVSFTEQSDKDDYFNMIVQVTDEEYSYPTYTVTLHKVQHGNMQTDEISTSDFFK
jgi:disulfide oxidoreductase YuzD